MNLLQCLLRGCFKTAALEDYTPQFPDIELPLDRVGKAVITISNETMPINSLLEAGQISQGAWNALLEEPVSLVYTVPSNDMKTV